jgi:hypothetical protein
MVMLRRHWKKDDAGGDRYRRLSIELGQAELASALAVESLDEATQAHARLGEVRAAYQTLGAAVQEPLPAARALDRERPRELTRRLSTMRTRRQWHLMSAPPGALAPAAVRPASRAPLGPHVAGLEADFAERPWGVDFEQALDRGR